ncbi:PD-(D/E)XK nuclease family protein [Alkalibacterium pelagium]|uniref:DNA helicase/exodeoxyribonuclease V, subunit B n=1 Tax=Alkalibacterium pelagium TaxID=426702 RepID=A0A1H7L0Z2_9LACT|nr:PD-(D/E)XK nuclease family protein [Alkalibacterium pelagium]GEN50717.1 ATP-dependent helicase/deoxyribonuclease subunit B [Alkalibacterium pelagium]SEK92723.1 DNA helicase/exodeoxyribonuclease V, subunit B [Alkalibacterium pelagium]
MGLQFILSRLQRDKKKILFDQMMNWMEDKDAQVFYLVPDHMKFESEMAILDRVKDSQPDNDRHLAGMINLQVFSFSRLAWYFLQDTALYSHSQLTETGLTMLMRRLLRENEEALTIFRGESQQQGFVEKTTELFMELRNARVMPKDLTDISSQLFEDEPGTRDFLLKLKDITILYDSFLSHLEGKYIEKEDVLEALIEEVKTRDLSHTHIIIDNFHRFSAQEQELVLQMVENAKDVKVSLVLDKKHAVEPPEMTDFFYQTGMTYFRLYQEARNRRLPVLNDTVVNDNNKERCDALQNFEDYWVSSFDLSPKAQPGRPTDYSSCIEIREAESRQAEVLHTATTIKKIVAEGNHRYKDILVIARTLDDYKMLMDSTFAENDIPLFIDEADKMSNHALVECIQSLVNIYKRHYRYEDVMRFLKTELFIPLEDERIIPKEKNERLSFWSSRAESWRKSVDTLENVMLAYGYEGNDWVRDDDWIYARFHLEEMDDQLDADKRMQEQANQARSIVRSAFLPFFKQLDRVGTNREAVRLIYQFLERHRIDAQLLYWRDQALEDGDLEDARKHEQVWQTFIQLLDEFVDVLGDETWEVDTFLSILETGFEQATYSIVPPSIDQVMFTQFDKSRLNCKKLVVIMGMTDTQLPMNTENDSILTDEDREQLGVFLPDDKFLMPSTAGRLANEPFTAYLAFLNASDKLILSYPVKNDGSGDNRLSPYVERLNRQLDIPINRKYTDAGAVTDDSTDLSLSFVGSRRQTIGQLVTILRDRLDHKNNPPIFWTILFQKLQKQSNEVEKNILKSLEYRNIPRRLSPELAEELYGKDLYLSVSQLESFYLDPYSHFLQYGLKLRERAVQELTPAETGTFFHDALDSIFRAIISSNLSFDQLNEDELESVTEEVLQELYQNNKFKLLSMSNRMKFIRKQLSRTIQQMVKALSNQTRRTQMRPRKSEVLFGRLGSREGVPGLNFPLNTGGNLYVRGKIDRLDALELDNELYLSIVDYKSSRKALKFDEIYHGLMMQMLTYLDTAVHYSEDIFGKKAKPAGAFYAHVNNPMLKASDLLKKDWLDVWLKSFKMDGIILNEDELVEKLDLTLPENKYSLVYPLEYVKTRDQIKGKLITMDDLDLLFRHNREKIREAGNRILSGENALSPIYDKKEFTPSVRGIYQPVSQFDVLLPNGQNQYRELESISDQSDLIDKLKSKYLDLSERGADDN